MYQVLESHVIHLRGVYGHTRVFTAIEFMVREFTVKEFTARGFTAREFTAIKSWESSPNCLFQVFTLKILLDSKCMEGILTI